MAGNTYTINFDTGIEKVEYSGSLDIFPYGEVTSTGQKISGLTELYVRPVFKQGYELDTTNISETKIAGIYSACDDNKMVVTNVIFTSKQGGGAIL